MRKIYLLILIHFALNWGGELANAQSQRLVLLEEFSNMYCGPCVFYGPRVTSFLDSNTTKICCIRYQVYWPHPDTIYLQNPNQVNDRISYYGAGYVPIGYEDGNYWSSETYNITQSSLDTRYAMLSPFSISVIHNLSSGGDTIFTRTKFTKTDTASGHLLAHVVVIEKHVNLNFPPLHNADTNYNFIMKQMLPNSLGIPLPYMNVGESFVLDLSWKLANVFNTAELAVVSFVQNNNNKEVLQAGYSPTRTTFNYTGIEPVNLINNIFIYPNPTTSTLTIHQDNYSPNQQIILTDVLGNRVYSQALNTATEMIDISQLSSGIYFYEVRSGLDSATSYRGKFIKE